MLVVGKQDHVDTAQVGGGAVGRGGLGQDGAAGRRVVAGGVEGRVGQEPQAAVLEEGGRAAEQWLVDRGLAPVDTGMMEMCATLLRSLREQVRALLAAHTAGRPAPDGALAAVNDALTRAPAASLLRWDPARGLYRETAHPTTQIVEHALAVLAADTADLLTSPDAERLTACASTPCSRYLLRTGRRHWCSTRCGDRARAARAYARRTQATTS
ncbi:hypothetical protein SACE_7345 [Saccharopolyspora erythraea NRRL 2338]|uniref:Zinc finger CGNR domain-containing protein n=1 Tax=Saccharopolyspora erythraea (strain ATCC 11635 / DSM 40517 / JCM 4748 / NBRC 13426 / NCIMB 8594 / NRRL 2338) TaxID=405948 RepID=A4FR26_SACEN|nr:hypothetical protein SACE_7345 [Saccharopolyspora erythraea NRRL 2338]